MLGAWLQNGHSTGWKLTELKSTSAGEHGTCLATTTNRTGQRVGRVAILTIALSQMEFGGHGCVQFGAAIAKGQPSGGAEEWS